MVQPKLNSKHSLAIGREEEMSSDYGHVTRACHGSTPSRWHNHEAMKFLEHADGLYFFDSLIQSDDTSLGKLTFLETSSLEESMPPN
jgi:hypothetical protein